MKRYVKSAIKKNKQVNISASTATYGMTVGMLNAVYPSNLKVIIFGKDSVGDADVIFDGYLPKALKTYPELADCVITYLSPAGGTKISIDVNADFDYTPAW